MVWVAIAKSHTELLADKQECAMEFHTGTITIFGIFEGQHRFLLGQAMDLNTMV